MFNQNSASGTSSSMHPDEEEDRIEYELRQELTAAWVVDHQDVEPEMDLDDSIDEAIITSPRREISPLIRERNYASAVDTITPLHYRTFGQWGSCPHVLDDPFESEEEENQNPDEIVFLTNVHRSCQDCHFFGTDYTDRVKSAQRKTTLVRNAKTTESVPNFEKGILTCCQSSHFQAQGTQSEILRGQSQSSSESGSSSVSKVNYSASAPGYQKKHVQSLEEPELDEHEQEEVFYSATPMPVVKRCKISFQMPATYGAEDTTEPARATDVNVEGEPAAVSRSTEDIAKNSPAQNLDLELTSGVNQQVSQEAGEFEAVVQEDDETLPIDLSVPREHARDIWYWCLFCQGFFAAPHPHDFYRSK